MNIIKIGLCIKENRERKGLTQLQLAQLLEVDIASVQAYEEGKKKLTSKELKEISDALDIPLVVLCYGGGEVEMLQRNENGTICKWKKY